MLLVADVHGAAHALGRVAAQARAEGVPLLVLGDLINIIDYRTHEGIFVEAAGAALVAEVVELRRRGDYEAAAGVWHGLSEEQRRHIRARFDELIEAEYLEVIGALDGAEAFVTYGNVDRPELIKRSLPASARFVDGEVLTIGELRVGVAGGGMLSAGTAGEVSEEDMAAKLDAMGPVDVLCSHLPPAIRALGCDVIGGGRCKGSEAIRRYVLDTAPAFHYFGDVHQPQATQWRLGSTLCRNVGYFRATGKAVRHG